PSTASSSSASPAKWASPYLKSSSSSTVFATTHLSARAGKDSPPENSPKSKPASPAGSVSKLFSRIFSIAIALPSNNASPPSASPKTSASSPTAPVRFQAATGYRRRQNRHTNLRKRPASKLQYTESGPRLEPQTRHASPSHPNHSLRGTISFLCL